MAESWVLRAGVETQPTQGVWASGDVLLMFPTSFRGRSAGLGLVPVSPGWMSALPALRPGPRGLALIPCPLGGPSGAPPGQL